MTAAIIKSMFFPSYQGKDNLTNIKLARVQTLMKEFQQSKQQQLGSTLKQLLNLAFLSERDLSLLQTVYNNAFLQSPIEWVPAISKIMAIFSPRSSFMKLLIQAQDFKMPIEKCYLPTYLFRNNLLNQKTGYQNVTHSMGGLLVPIFDYYFIRILHAIQNITFKQISRILSDQYQSDDMYYHLSRNPFLMLLKMYLQHFSTNRDLLKRIIGNIKMFFVDEILVTQRINKSTMMMRNYSFTSQKHKIKAHYFLVILLVLKYDQDFFDQKNLYFQQLISRFSQIIQDRNDAYLRYFFRVFLYAYSKPEIQDKVIECLDNAKQGKGMFQIQRYSNSQFVNSVNKIEKGELHYYNSVKTVMLKLLQKDQNIYFQHRVHFGTIRTIGCFLKLQLKLKKQNPNLYKQSSNLKSQQKSIRTAIQKIENGIRYLKKLEQVRKSKQFTKQVQQNAEIDIKELKDLYEKVYDRKIMQKAQRMLEPVYGRDQKARGNNEDFSFCQQTYKIEISDNPWKAPLKQSQYRILYNLFRWIAMKLDRVLPGEIEQQPRVNLRFMCNPFMFMFVLIVIVVLIKIFL